MDITAEQLASIYSIKADVASKWVKPLNDAMNKFAINTPARQAAFLAQVGHESGRLSLTLESFNYKTTASLRAVFGKYFPTEEAAKAVLAKTNKQEAIAAIVYSNRMGNGDINSGDAFRYRGRGIMQVTGRAGYVQVAQALSIDCVNHPELLEQPVYAALSAAWFWDNRHLNFYADKQDILTITKKINGGTNGLDDRKALYDKARKVLNV